MNEEIRLGGTLKKYLCAVHGKMEKKHDILTAYLFKDSRVKTAYVTDDFKPGSKKIVTEYSLLAYNREKDLSLLEISLHTGRTHQIRAHMAHIGHVLLGDGKYGKNKNDRADGWFSQALYSYKLGFDPKTDFFEYLRGRYFTVDMSKIKFLSLFDMR